MRAWIAGRYGSADDAWRHAAEHARRAGAEQERFDILGWRASAAGSGPMPLQAAIERCEEILHEVADSRVARAVTLRPLAALYAMRGELAPPPALSRPRRTRSSPTSAGCSRRSPITRR